MGIQDVSSDSATGKGLHRFAVLTACCTWLLIIAGALVTGNEAGLAVPDWPLSYGSLMPPMVGGIIYEHGHRMIATTVGLLTVMLVAWLWRKEPRPSVRLLGLFALGAVIAQGILGGMTVLFFLPTGISVAHGCLAQAFFCMAVSLAWVTSAQWKSGGPIMEDPDRCPLRRLGILTMASVYGQLILGAYLRHSKSGILLHVAGALIVSLLAIWVFVRVTGRYPNVSGLHGPAVLLISLLSLQLFLGIGSYWIRAITRDAVQPERLAVVITTAHVAVGALVLAVCLILTLQASRLLTVPVKAPGYTPTPQNVTS